MFVEKNELNKYYYNLFNKDFPASTLSKWKKEGKIKTIEHPKFNNRYLYNLDDFTKIINSEQYLSSLRASKQNPNDYIGKTSGSLLIKGIVPEEEKTINYSGTLMYCQCLNCGRTDLVQVKFSYLTPNGNYHQETCGCGRKERAFLASSREGLDNSFLKEFPDFNYYLFVHKFLTSSTDKYYIHCDIIEYQEAITYFYYDEQLKLIFDFWKQQEQYNTQYDWSKPSLDHLIPKSKGGTNKLNNLQALTVFENLAKRDMTWQEWTEFKQLTNTKSDYFLESIKGGN